RFRSSRLATQRMEEKRLSYSSLYGFGQKRLSDEISRFWPFAGQESLRISGDEDDGDIEAAQDLGDGVDARAAFAEIDVGKHEAGFGCTRLGDGLVLGRGRAHDFVTELDDKIFEVQRDDGFVFDDENARGELTLDRVLSFDDGLLHLLRLLVENFPGF